MFIRRVGTWRPQGIAVPQTGFHCIAVRQSKLDRAIGITLRDGTGADAPPAVSQGTRRREPCHRMLPVKLLQGSSGSVASVAGVAGVGVPYRLNLMTIGTPCGCQLPKQVIDVSRSKIWKK